MFPSMSLSASTLLLFSRPVASHSLPPHELQHARLPCPSPSPTVCPSSCPLHRRCHPAVSMHLYIYSSVRKQPSIIFVVLRSGLLNSSLTVHFPVGNIGRNKSAFVSVRVIYVRWNSFLHILKQSLNVFGLSVCV